MNRLQSWQRAGERLHAWYSRSPAEGAIVFVGLECVISAIHESSICLKGQASSFNAVMIGAEFIDGPMTSIDVKAGTETEFDAVQIKLRGGDSLTLSMRPTARPVSIEGEILKLTADMRDE